MMVKTERESSKFQSWGTLTRGVVVAIALFVLATVLYLVRAAIGPLIVATLLAYILNPAVVWLAQYGRLSQKTAVVPVYLLFLVVLITLPVILIPILVRQGQGLAVELANFELQTIPLVITLEQLFGFDFTPLADPLSQIQQGLLGLFRPELAVNLLQAVLRNLAWVAVMLVTIFYLLRDWSGLRDWLISIAPEEAQPEIWRIYREIKVVWQAYLRGQLLLMFLVGISSAVGGAIVGLPGALLLGLLAGLLDVIPSVGPVVAMVVAIFIAGIEGSTYLPVSNIWFMVIVAAVYNVIQVVENIWWRPRVMAHSLKIHPGLVFLAVIAALVFVGPVAALIVVPTIGSISIIGRTISQGLRGAPGKFAP
jgi:predicted PurR-regulated permease PerM